MTSQTNKKVTLSIGATITEAETVDRNGEKVGQATLVITDTGWPGIQNIPRLQTTIDYDPGMPEEVANLVITEGAKRNLLQFTALGLIAEFRAQQERKRAEQELYATIGRSYVEMRKKQEEKREGREEQEDQQVG